MVTVVDEVLILDVDPVVGRVDRLGDPPVEDAVDELGVVLRLLVVVLGRGALTEVVIVVRSGAAGRGGEGLEPPGRVERAVVADERACPYSADPSGPARINR